MELCANHALLGSVHQQEHLLKMKLPSKPKYIFRVAVLCGFPIVWMVFGSHVLRWVDIFGVYRAIQPGSPFTAEFGYEFLRCVETLLWFLPFAYFYMAIEGNQQEEQAEFGLKKISVLFLGAGCFAFFGFLGVIGLQILIVWPLDSLGFHDWASTAYQIISARKR